VSAPEPRLLSVNVWDKRPRHADGEGNPRRGLGLNPQPDGQLIRIPLPELTAERRAELAKLGHKYAEQARVAVRNVRRDAWSAEEGREGPQDLGRTSTARIRRKYRSYPTATSRQVDDVLATKEKEIKDGLMSTAPLPASPDSSSAPITSHHHGWQRRWAKSRACRGWPTPRGAEAVRPGDPRCSRRSLGIARYWPLCPRPEELVAAGRPVETAT